MQKYIILGLLILSFTLTTACKKEEVNPEDNNSSEIVYEESFKPFIPYIALEEKLLKEIGADGFIGTDKEIAEQILKWQQENMQYIGDPNVKPDISHPMRWNYMIPGIFPVSEMVKERVLENGKIYGLCWDYATIFNAIANSYQLEVRITALKKYLSDINPSIDPSTKEGISIAEYDLLNKKITANAAKYTYGQIDRVAKETWVHYRAEVKINNKWISMDGTTVSGEYETGAFEVATWDEGYNNVLLNAPSAMENNILDIEALEELLKYAPTKNYTGIIDDAKNNNRAASFKDLIRGRGLIPYYKNTSDLILFLQIPQSDAKEILDDTEEIITSYEEGTKKDFYAIADFLLYSGKDDDFEYTTKTYVDLYNALTGSNMTETDYNKYVK